jgi:hypothetical protein
LPQHPSKAERRDRIRFDLASWGIAAALIAAAELWLTLAGAPTNSGANIGAGLAFLAILAAGIAAAAGLLLRQRELRAPPRPLLTGAGVVALVIAGGLIVLVGLGIVEELS